MLKNLISTSASTFIALKYFEFTAGQLLGSTASQRNRFAYEISSNTFRQNLPLPAHYSTGRRGRKSKNGNNARRKKSLGGSSGKMVPKLLYIQHPMKYLKNKFDLLRLKLLWDFSFSQEDFVYGTTQAVVVMSDYIRHQNAVEIHDVTTSQGFKQIARDMIISRDDPRLRLLRFRMNDIQRVIPVKVHLIKYGGRRHCLIDMFFVGMRNINDFNSTTEEHEVREDVRRFDITKTINLIQNPNRIIFAEIYARFYREFTKGAPDEWSVAFYKVANFDVL